jgi:hypothetical protein
MKHPTYHDLGDHSESIAIDFDPTKISYEKLLEVFWASHCPTADPVCVQYRNAIFYASPEQEKAAKASRDELSKKIGQPVTTAIEKLVHFWRAEDYHQKYALQGHPAIARELKAIYPDMRAFTDSTAAARLNCWLAGSGDRKLFEAEIDQVGVSKEAQAALRARMGRAESRKCGTGE